MQVFLNITKDINSLSDKYANRNPFTNVYGLARSLLAFGTLLTLIFNETNSLFIESFSFTNNDSFLTSINLFSFFNYPDLFWGKIIACFLLLGVISGYYQKITGILHWWVSFSFFQLCPIVDGGDQITCIITLLLIPTTLFDNRKNHWSPVKLEYVGNSYINILCNVFILIIKMQMAFLYFQAGIEKLKVEEWVNGTAVYYWFNHNVFGSPNWLRATFNSLLTNSWVVSLICWGTILLEILLGSALFMQPSRRKKLFGLALIFHFSIILIHGLMSFFFAMTGGVILYLLPIENQFNFSRIKIPFINKPQLVKETI